MKTLRHRCFVSPDFSANENLLHSKKAMYSIIDSGSRSCFVFIDAQM